MNHWGFPGHALHFHFQWKLQLTPCTHAFIFETPVSTSTTAQHQVLPVLSYHRTACIRIWNTSFYLHNSASSGYVCSILPQDGMHSLEWGSKIVEMHSISMSPSRTTSSGYGRVSASKLRQLSQSWCPNWTSASRKDRQLQSILGYTSSPNPIFTAGPSLQKGCMMTPRWWLFYVMF